LNFKINFSEYNNVICSSLTPTSVNMTTEEDTRDSVHS